MMKEMDSMKKMGKCAEYKSGIYILVLLSCKLYLSAAALRLMGLRMSSIWIGKIGILQRYAVLQEKMYLFKETIIRLQ